MRIYPVQYRYSNTYGQSKISKSNSVRTDILNSPHTSGLVISFTGKNLSQFASYAPENKRYKAIEYNQGGLGVVAHEAPESWRKLEGADVRDFSPYHSYNADGGIRIVKLEKRQGKYLDKYPEKNFFSAKQNETLEEVSKRLNLEGEELAYVIQQAPDKSGYSKIIKLEDTGIKGAFTRPSDKSIFEPQVINYRLFKAVDIQAPTLKDEKNAAYFIHTPGTAQFKTAYGSVNSAYSTYGTQGEVPVENYKIVSSNVMYADNNRAFVEIMPKLNTPSHGNYNPANWWLHDRPAFMVLNAAANKSYFGDAYYNGLKAHGTFHNPGRDYQGAESNPFEFFRMVAEKEDIERLQKHPQAETLKKIEAKWNIATDEERKFAYQIMDQFLMPFKDELGTYNITMTPVAGVKSNPMNFSAGTVSINYGNEMKSPNTPDIAKFMTNKLAEINTINITNGSTPANLKLNDASADFCQKDEINGITKLKTGYTPYEYKPVIKNGKIVSDNIDEIIKAKKSNTKWLLDSIGDAFDRGGQTAVKKMFCSDKQMEKGAGVIGHLSKYSEGDILLMGWGRPDRQKGYPSTFQALLEFLKDPNIPQETKLHTKLLVGAGVWDKNARDYNWVKDIIRQIEELDGGIYKGNACYVNNFFSNRLVSCATYSIFTSRSEPCGITPLESFASGTPVISTKTGGAPDFIKTTRGYLTENAYMRNIEELNIDSKELAGKYSEELENAIDAKRMYANASELKRCIAAATADYNIGTGKLSKYAQMVRDSISQKIDWHENAAYNGGKSANERYMTEVFEINKGSEARSMNTLKRLVGDRFGIADSLKENVRKAKNKWVKLFILSGLAISTFGTFAYINAKKNTTKPIVDIPKEPQPSTNPTIEKRHVFNSFNKVA